MDFILNGAPTGNVASRLMQHNFDIGALRPIAKEDGTSYMIVNRGGRQQKIIANAPATLRKDDWILLDQAALSVAKPRLRAVADVRSRGLEFTIPNGMSKTVLEYEKVSDITPATISMDGLARSDADRPHFDLAGLPLPIIHKDFQYSARQVMASRNGGSPLDTTTAELAARRVAEEAEKLLIGTSPEYSYATYPIYGLTNHPDALTKVMTAPDGSNQAITVREVLDMRGQSQGANYFGPWMLYTSLDWDSWLDEDYSSAKGDNTLRDRLRAIEGIQEVRTLDYLPAKTMVLVQMAPEVVREVVGMDLTTVQWETHGGMLLNFKVLAIMVPQVRSDYENQTGIVVGTHP